MFEEIILDELEERLGASLKKWLMAAIEESSPRLWPAWMTVKTAGEYIDKTYGGMRYALTEFPREIPVAMMGDKPMIDKKDLDKFFMNRKGKK